MFVFNGCGKLELTRVRALAGLWAMLIGGMALYEFVAVDPAKVQYLGGEYSYWMLHDTAGAAFHLIVIFAWLRPSFERRVAKTVVFPAFMFTIYVLYMSTMVLELHKFGDGDCLSQITQCITYFFLPIVSYFAVLNETTCKSLLMYFVTSLLIKKYIL